ncbi:hypothetical protein B0T09DRAFT_412459 [Sordaria sp. MPI-SDFR-AT-0083]|nr:hypothetical protein B0T09DRAFT_412459 [Sordaria sp. MPI-SDFR-AT-0083]
MPTYLCHGFRWQRRSIRVYTVVQDLDDVSPEWLIRPTSSRCLLQSFYNLFEFLPYCSPQGGESWEDSEESDEDEGEDGASDEEQDGKGKLIGGSSCGEDGEEKRDERSQWPERVESLGILGGGSGGKVRGKGNGKSVEGRHKGDDASSAITAIHVRGSSSSSNEPTSRTASRSPSLKLPLQGSRTSSSKTRQTSTTATTLTTTTTIPFAPVSRSPSTLGVSSSFDGGRKSKKTSRSRSSSHSPNRKKDELSAQRWSAVKVLEEYDPNNLDEVSRPYAYISDHVVRVDGAVDILAEVRRYEERMQQEQKQGQGQKQKQKRGENGEEGEKGGHGRDYSIINNKKNRDSAGSGGTAAGRSNDEEFHDALEHPEEEKEQTWIEQLRDELQRGEELQWYVVVNGDEERNYSNDSDEEDDGVSDEDENEDEDYTEEEISSRSNYNYNYGTSYGTEDHLTAYSELSNHHSSLAAHPPTISRPSVSHSGSRTSSRARGGQSKSRSQSRSHSRSQTRGGQHRSRSRQRHSKKSRRPKPTKEQRQHHAQQPNSKLNLNPNINNSNINNNSNSYVDGYEHNHKKNSNNDHSQGITTAADGHAKYESDH